MKAIILAAGVGSRLRPLTDEQPKSLLKVGNQTILGHMVSHLLACGVQEIAIVTGYRSEKIRQFMATTFPHLTIHYIHNDEFESTNTAYSLFLTREWVRESDFVKFDADVVFEKTILERLLASESANALCIDREINLAAEEVKVQLNEEGKVIHASKHVTPAEAVGESIGIEKISSATAEVLFKALENLIKNPEDKKNEYYEGAYELLFADGVSFGAVDISGLKWVEMDTHEDYALACRLFA